MRQMHYNLRIDLNFEARKEYWMKNDVGFNAAPIVSPIDRPFKASET